ncbi:hypothetical protein [Shinella sedimenti]|uniref:Uncharacterized protein n=1 Tax=Shinella sedimenti TaxID=2919913 RepID=A0ABT0CT36_9HYPH|nr:hypothetical protein [Shinella sedimenti]MCJ8151772.1 hypothetical protein [Shinella sedimenti]
MLKRALLLSALLLTPPVAQASDLGFAAEANTICRAIIDGRNHQTFKAARDQTLELTAAHLRGEAPPTPAEAKTLSKLLQAVNVDLAAAIARLQSLPPSPKLEAFLGYGQSRIDINKARIGFLADLDNWQWPPADGLASSRYDFKASTADLGFTDRDCTFVFDSLGNPPAIANFIAAVAPVCSAEYDRLIKTDINQWRRHNIHIVAALRQNKLWDPEAIAALHQLAVAWRDTTNSFRQAANAINSRPPQWVDVLSNMERQAAIFQNRAGATASGDAEAIAQAFAVRLSVPDFRELGLQETSCIALGTLM